MYSSCSGIPEGTQAPRVYNLFVVRSQDQQMCTAKQLNIELTAESVFNRAFDFVGTLYSLLLRLRPFSNTL